MISMFWNNIFFNMRIVATENRYHIHQDGHCYTLKNHYFEEFHCELILALKCFSFSIIGKLKMTQRFFFPKGRVILCVSLVTDHCILLCFSTCLSQCWVEQSQVPDRLLWFQHMPPSVLPLPLVYVFTFVLKWLDNCVLSAWGCGSKVTTKCTMSPYI